MPYSEGMEWMTEWSAWRWRIGFTAVGSAIVLGFLWWALADLVLATFEFPSRGLERWREGDTEAPDGGDTGTLVAA